MFGRRSKIDAESTFQNTYFILLHESWSSSNPSICTFCTQILRIENEYTEISVSCIVSLVKSHFQYYIDTMENIHSKGNRVEKNRNFIKSPSYWTLNSFCDCASVYSWMTKTNRFERFINCILIINSFIQSQRMNNTSIFFIYLFSFAFVYRISLFVVRVNRIQWRYQFVCRQILDLTSNIIWYYRKMVCSVWKVHVSNSIQYRHWLITTQNAGKCLHNIKCYSMFRWMIDV